MVSEHHLKESFARVKQDIEGTKDELAEALKRITKLETAMFKASINKISKAKKSK